MKNATCCYVGDATAWSCLCPRALFPLPFAPSTPSCACELTGYGYNFHAFVSSFRAPHLNADRGYGLQRPTLQDEDLAELDSIYSTGSMASQYSSQPIYSNGVFFPPSPSLSRSNSHPALQDDGEADEDDGFLLGFGAGLVEAEDAHEAEYTAADSQKILFE